MFHLIVNLGCVDLDFEYLPVPILPGLMGIWQKRLGKMVEQRNQSQSNPGTWDRCPVHTSETSFNPRSTSSTNAMTPCLRAERNESISQRILTSVRVRTRGAQGNQIHISTLWTLGIPKKNVYGNPMLLSPTGSLRTFYNPVFLV